MPNVDAFPTTQRTLLGRLLEQGDSGRAEAVRHVMEVYAEPLLVYVRGSSFRKVDDPQALVHGFLADRLGRPDYLHQWLLSQRRLRRWLLTGFRFYLLETVGAKARARRVVAREHEEHAAETAFDRAVAMALVRETLRAAEADCRERGLELHWDMFIAHHLHGAPLAELADAHGLSQNAVKSRVRTAAVRLRRRLRDAVRWRGASDAAIDQEIHELLDALRQRSI